MTQLTEQQYRSGLSMCISQFNLLFLTNRMEQGLVDDEDLPDCIRICKTIEQDLVKYEKMN